MNPELQRNFWLEMAPFRLALITCLLLLAFAATSLAQVGGASPPSAALALYWFFAVLWGTRSAALSVVAEIRERTWDGQKLSSIGPWEMVWGKLLGATAANWYGAFLCLFCLVGYDWREHGPANALVRAGILLAVGGFAQAVAMLASLVLIRRNSGNWRLDTFLCQVAGIGAGLAFFSLLNWFPALEESALGGIVWWGHRFNFNSFQLASLLLFLGWSLIGCWRAMRVELCFANGPYVWWAFLVFLSLYCAGFQSAIFRPADLLFDTQSAVGRLMLAALPLLVSTYVMVFLEPKDPVRLRWLGERIAASQFYRAFLALDCWMLSYGATWIIALILAAVSAGGGAPAALVLSSLSALGFLTRDAAIFVLMGRRRAGRGDFAALVIIAGALYLLMPLIVHGLGMNRLGFIFLPTRSGFPGLVAAWAQGAVFAALALRRIAR